MVGNVTENVFFFNNKARQRTKNKMIVDSIVFNGTLLTMNSKFKRYSCGGLAIKDGAIFMIGDSDSIVSQCQAKESIDARNGIIMPGLINAHSHIPMTCFRGIADDMPLMKWLNNYIFPLEAKFVNKELVYYGSLLGMIEMIKSGTTTFCDMYFFEDETARAAKLAGIRCLLGEVLLDFPTPNAKTPAEGLAYSKMLLEAWRNDPLVKIIIEPHSLYTCSKDLLISARALAKKFNVPIGLHLLENIAERAMLEEKLKMPAVNFLKEIDYLDDNFFAFHCVAVDEYDLDMFASAGSKIVHNAVSNMKLASGMAPIVAMRGKGITVGIGTDGCASNNRLDMFAELSCVARLAKIRENDPAVIDATSAVAMATIDGAKTLSMENEIGSLEVGKKADIIILDMNKPHLTPLYNEYSHLAYAVSGSDVRTTIINGKVVMRDYELQTVDEQEVIAKVNEIAKKIRTHRFE